MQASVLGGEDWFAALIHNWLAILVRRHNRCGRLRIRSVLCSTLIFTDFDLGGRSVTLIFTSRGLAPRLSMIPMPTTLVLDLGGRSICIVMVLALLGLGGSTCIETGFAMATFSSLVCGYV